MSEHTKGYEVTEDGRRIVACVNACKGIPTESLEGFSVQEMESAAMKIERHRDELLAALKKISAIEDQMYGADWDEIEQARSIANSAIDKAEKQLANNADFV